MSLVAALFALTGGVVGAAADRPSSAGAGRAGYLLVELNPTASAGAESTLRRSGATLVSGALRLYRLRASRSERTLATLRADGAVRLTAVDRPMGSLAVADFADPLVGQQWWRSALGLGALVPPGPGKPVTIIDSGVNFNHPEFTGRANLLALDAQEPAPVGGVHGTAVASLLGAPVNGVGIVGIYPGADLASWDAAQGSGTELDISAIAAGILAAADRGPGVINLSVGSNQRSPIMQQAIARAIRKGSLVVAAAGNDGEKGSPLTYPASLPHVLTVGATDESNRPVPFSSRSAYVDLAAPGVDMTVADALSGGWATSEGTSFSTPLVSGAAAWIWTARPELDASQLAEVLRRSAIDLDVPGRDDATGYGLLNVGLALTYGPVPISDQLEPNDDVNYVKPGALYDTGIPALTTRSRRMDVVEATVESAEEDPRDVYRVWLPARTTTTVALTSDQGLDLRLLAGSVASVAQGSGVRLLAAAQGTAPSKRVVYQNSGKGTAAYLVVAPGSATNAATYRLQIRSR